MLCVVNMYLYISTRKIGNVRIDSLCLLAYMYHKTPLSCNPFHPFPIQPSDIKTFLPSGQLAILWNITIFNRYACKSTISSAPKCIFPAFPQQFCSKNADAFRGGGFAVATSQSTTRPEPGRPCTAACAVCRLLRVAE